MTITIDWASKVIEADASILDLPAFHAELRDAEDSATGMLYPVTHTWKALDIGGGAFFYQLDLVNGWALKFPVAGNYVIRGNLKGPIVSVPGVYVERETSAAYVTTAVGGSGPSAGDIAAALLAALQSTTIPVDARRMNGALVVGTGTEVDPWRGEGVSP